MLQCDSYLAACINPDKPLPWWNSAVYHTVPQYDRYLDEYTTVKVPVTVVNLLIDYIAVLTLVIVAVVLINVALKAVWDRS